MEEFNEDDVLWPDIAHHHRHRPADSALGHRRQHATGHQQQPRAAVVVHPPLQSSLPVRIPSMPPPSRDDDSWTRSRSYDGDEEEGGVVPPPSRDDDSWTRSRSYDGDEEEGGVVPPHVLVARRCAEDQRRVVASSVCVGQGRTLKGRDLRAVRNAVLHMTGFLSSSDKY